MLRRSTAIVSEFPISLAAKLTLGDEASYTITHCGLTEDDSENAISKSAVLANSNPLFRNRDGERCLRLSHHGGDIEDIVA